MKGPHELRAWRVRGRVQGVGFRWNTVQQGRSLGLEGSVWNCADGTVEVHARGRPEALERLGDWLSVGPRGARVEAVEDIEAGPGASAEGFHVVI